MTTYDEAQMLRFTLTDRYLTFMLNDMTGKGHTQSAALEVLFNSNVLDDSAMTAAYDEVGK